MSYVVGLCKLYKFRRYEDSSLRYTGINHHEGDNVGLYDTTISANELGKVFENETIYVKSNSNE